MNDEGTYDSFAESHWEKFVRAAQFMGLPAQDAEDAAQVALIKCFKSWRRVRAADNPSRYAFKILFNTVRDMNRANVREARASAPVPHAQCPPSLNDFDLRDIIERALENLSTEQRGVLVLRVMIGFSEGDTAGILKIPTGTVKSRLSRALKVLHESPALVEIGVEI